MVVSFKILEVIFVMKDVSTSAQKQCRLPHLLVVFMGLLIAYFPKYINKVLNRLGLQFGPEGPPSVILWNWLAVIILIVFITVIERRNLSTIMLVRPQKRDLEWACIFWGIGMGWNWITNIIVPPPQTDGLDTIINLPIPVIIALILTTSITEEILFRGYPVERLRELTGRTWIAVSFSFILFLLPHIRFFGVHWLLYHGFGTVLLYILYVWRRNLWACILMHFLSNAPLLIPAISQGSV